MLEKGPFVCDHVQKVCVNIWKDDGIFSHCNCWSTGEAFHYWFLKQILFINLNEQELKTGCELSFSSLRYQRKISKNNRRQGRQQESKLNFSIELHLYCYKTEVSVPFSGFTVFVSKHRPGSRSNISMFWAELRKHLAFFKKDV